MVNLAAFIFVGLLTLGGIYIVVGSFVGSRIARLRAARLSCPRCKRSIGADAVKTAANIQDERNAKYVRELDLMKNESADIHFRNLLPTICPHCQIAHEFDLDEIGIGPV